MQIYMMGFNVLERGRIGAEKFVRRALQYKRGFECSDT